eukprot:8364426-Alexandrium_andersonii.AAC.1
MMLFFALAAVGGSSSRLIASTKRATSMAFHGPSPPMRWFWQKVRTSCKTAAIRYRTAMGGEGA